MLLRRLLLVLVISSLFTVGLCRRHGGTKRKTTNENKIKSDTGSQSPLELTTTSPTVQLLTSKPDLNTNEAANKGTPKYDSNVPITTTEVSGDKLVSKDDPSKTGSAKTDSDSRNKTKSNVGKHSPPDVVENQRSKLTQNLKADNDIKKESNGVANIGSATGGSGGSSAPKRADLSEDLPYTNGGGLTEMLNPAAKGVADVVNTFLTFWGPGQAWMSIKQILFFHLFIISFYYLLVVLLKGCIALINLKRTPLLIYKEVEDYKEVKPYPAPVLPPPHKDYGYEGGFKTSIGEEIQYVSYHEPHHEEHGDEGYHFEGPPAHGPPEVEHHGPPVHGPPEVEHHGPPVHGPPEVEHHGPPAGGHHGPAEEVFHEPPPLGHELGPVVPGGGGHGGVSSYSSYSGEVQPHHA